MTDKEIIASLRAAKELKKQYRELVKPVAEELAKRANEELGTTKYEGEIGCYDAGDDVICSHNNGPWNKESKDISEKKYDIEEKMRELFLEHQINMHYRIIG